MTEFNFETLRETWKDQLGHQSRDLSREEVTDFLKRESSGIAKQFHRGLVVDMWLKGLFLSALGMLLVLFHSESTIHWINTLVLAGIAFLVFFEWKTLRAIPGPTVIVGTLRAYLSEVTGFYRVRYARTIWMCGLTGPLVFYTGSLYYSYFKYDGIRPLDSTDFTVFAIFIAIAYIISVLAHGWQFRFHMRGMETCLSEIDTDAISAQQLRQRRFQRLVNRLFALVLLVMGILILGYFTTK